MNLQRPRDDGQAVEPLWRLMWRFLWPFQYFRDVTRGDRWQQQQAYRYNRAMRVHLPGFMLKWLILTLFCFGFGSLSEAAPGLTLLTAACFVTGCWTFIVVVLLGVDWLWLERFPDRF